MRVDELLITELLYAAGVILAAFLLGRIGTILVLRLNKRMRFSDISLRRVLRLYRVGIFLISLVIALAILQVSFAQELGLKIIQFLPALFVLVILWLLGYAVISLLVDFVAHFLMRFGAEYLQELGITERTANVCFFIIKVFFLLIFAAVSLKVAELSLPIIDVVILGLVFSFLVFAVAVLVYAFKDYLANFFLSTYVQKNVLKPGQYVRVENEVGEVTAITNHGAIISFSSGYKLVIPNAQLMREKLFMKRTRADIHKIEPLLKKYVVQLPSHCGPASAAMMLDFFGYSYTQEEVARHAKTKVRGKKAKKDWSKHFGTEPKPLISAVEKLTKKQVKGHLISYDEIDSLDEEVKVWLTEGALLLLWYKKPVLFPKKESQSGHFVLAVGVEDDSIIVMDPSRQTAGVYMVTHDLMEDAMVDEDPASGLQRGYIVFAKKGSPAYWRLTEKLYYSDAALYEQLSKSFERYLRKSLRESAVVREFISPFVELLFAPDEKKVKHLWRPDLGAGRKKR